MRETDIVFCGRRLSAQDIQLIRQLTADFPILSLHELASTVSELLNWHRPTGKVKTRECVDLLQHLATAGHLTGLPTLQPRSPRATRAVSIDSRSDPQPPVIGHVSDHQPIRLRVIDNHADRVLFRQHIQRYHYLGYRIPYGAQLRYFVQSSASSQPLLGCVLFTSAAWKMAPRDRWIGWDDATRRANLPRVVNHGRFLIFPWVQVDHLASHLLSCVARQLPEDWWTHYQVRPLLLETLVDVARFHGTCYRAANWIDLGLTQGRGRMDRHTQRQGHSPKRIFVYPLCRNACQLLCQPWTDPIHGDFH
jgi:Domain of unknown function (DUF4338)